MAERVKERQAGGSREEYVEIVVRIHGSEEVIRVKKGTNLNELLDTVKEEMAKKGVMIGNLMEWSISFNGTWITINADTGKASEEQNFVIEENSTLIMTQRVIGGR